MVPIPFEAPSNAYELPANPSKTGLRTPYEPMTDEPTVTVPSHLHGARTWRRLGERPLVSTRGRKINVGVWQTRQVCNEPFELELPRLGRSPVQAQVRRAIHSGSG